MRQSGVTTTELLQVPSQEPWTCLPIYNSPGQRGMGHYSNSGTQESHIATLYAAE